MHQYRTHKCNELQLKDAGLEVKLSGWVLRKRNHGKLIFIDLRDHYGITQCVINDDKVETFNWAEKLRLESVITISGKVIKRSAETINSELLTGEIEVVVDTLIIESEALILPFLVDEEDNVSEEIRLKYRFLDLRRAKQHNNIVLRSQIISFIRNKMHSLGFLEIQTPILTASSPEGARDFLVPSRKHPGKFYALPQAPQQFKQLLMISGYDKYFQIAPCFRDEDARADRTPGEFYQLDLEMAFVTQEDILVVVEDILSSTFKNFTNKIVTDTPFPRISYAESMKKYGSDKPDLRNPLIINNVTEVFIASSFTLFASLIAKGAFVRAIMVPDTASQPRSFFDKLNDWARKEGMGGLGYMIFDTDNTAKGPIAGKLSTEELAKLKLLTNAKNGDSLFFICGKGLKPIKFSGLVRDKLAQELDLIEKDVLKFCYIVDFPMYELNEENQQIDFSHNPFSMPQGGLNALETQNPLDIVAYQYDIVCNGIELSSGAIRNHKPEVMYKAFAIAGYTKEQVDSEFAGMINAFNFGAPPHGGSAPGIDRIVMLLSDAFNIREIIAFPLTQTGEDLLMNAPAIVLEKRLKELSIKVDLSKATATRVSVLNTTISKDKQE